VKRKPTMQPMSPNRLSENQKNMLHSQQLRQKEKNGKKIQQPSGYGTE
jgi:hypothetical protein